MKKTIALMCSAPLLAMILGCGSAPTPSAEPPPPASAGPIAPAASAAATAAGSTLETKTHDGFEIAVPRGSKHLDSGAPVKGLVQETYEVPLDANNLNALNISVSTCVGVESLDDAVRTATMMGTKEIALKKELAPGSLLVVKAPEGPSPMSPVEVWVFRRGKGGWFQAKCSGPSTHKDELVEVCSSLKVKS